VRLCERRRQQRKVDARYAAKSVTIAVHAKSYIATSQEVQEHKAQHWTYYKHQGRYSARKKEKRRKKNYNEIHDKKKKEEKGNYETKCMKKSIE